RPRLSDPQGSGRQANSLGASDGVGNTVRPGDQGSSSQPNSEERGENTSYRMEEKSDFMLEKFKTKSM
ncbi:HJURP isoform 8, partial [Pongo abelii]